jgi:PKD repeat protein
MKNLLVLLILILSNLLFSQDSLSVLFIGNSYTYTNDLPGMLNSLTLSLGDKITYNSQTAGGATFQIQTNTPAVYTKIKSKQWDYVVLQGQSQEPSFPTSQVNANTIPYAIQLADSIYKNKFCSQIMMFMTWGKLNGDPQWDSISTFNKMNGRLRDAYLRIMDSVQGSMSPVGSAWRYVRDNYPTINLYSSDGSHPSVEGTYLAACTFYASLYRKSPVGASFVSSIGATNAGILQNVAALTVLDSMDLWNLHPITELTEANFTESVLNGTVDFQNSSLKATNYSWDFGDGNTSIIQSPSHVYNSNGSFTVKLIASSPCDSDTMIKTIIISGLTNGIDVLELNNIRLLNLNNNLYQVIFDELKKGNLSIIDLNGNELMKEKFNSGSINFDLNTFSSGTYFVKLNLDNTVQTIRLVK